MQELTKSLASMTEGVAALETKARVDGIETLVGGLSAKAEELEGKIASTGAASAEASEAKVAELSSSTEVALAALKEEMNTLSSSMVSQKEEMLSKMDADGDGTIDKSEFTVWASAQAARVEELVASLAALKQEMTAKTESSVTEVQQQLSALTEEQASSALALREELSAGMAASRSEVNEQITQQLEASATALRAEMGEKAAAVSGLEERLASSSASVETRLSELTTALRSQGGGKTDIGEELENWMDQRLSAFDESKSAGVQETEDRIAEVESTLGLLQHKFSSTEQLAASLQDRFGELESSMEVSGTVSACCANRHRLVCTTAA